MSEQAPIVIFDLDETLTQYDTFMPFIRGYVRHYRRRRLLSLWRLIPALLQFRHWGSRTWLKTQMLRGFVGGESRQDLMAWSDRFVESILNHAMRDQGLVRLRAHQQAGARVILASASFDIYVDKMARKLDIPEVLGTRVQWDDNDCLAGMAGENCRDEEKLRRLKSLDGIPENGAGVTAYSDSHADLPMLRWAEHGYAVCPTRQLMDRLEADGLTRLQW